MNPSRKIVPQPVPTPQLGVIENAEDPELLGQYIPLHYHFPMLRDVLRLQGFKEAMEKTIPIGGRVMELGGGLGILSFFAAQRAAKVWTVEKLPELARTARRFLADNGCAERVTIIEGDARDYLPPEPVDVVVCEMLHVALIRERQIEVIRAFKANYLAKFGGPLPRFIPEASLLGVQAVEQKYEFLGYRASVPVFYEATKDQLETRGIADPIVYQIIDYGKDLPERLEWRGTTKITEKGTLNALRFVTKNLLSIVVEENRSIDWHNQYLVIPLARSLSVEAGDEIGLSFAYDPGTSIQSLAKSIEVSRI